jgi:AcrR family transcriptional regulator
VEQKPASPPTERGSKMRDKLKQAAAAVLERVGYRAMRLQDIAKEADVNVSLFYHYFSSKAEITHEVLTELLNQLVERQAQIRPTTHDPFDTLVNANLVTVTAYASTPGLFRCLLHFDEQEAAFSKLYRRVSLDWNRRIAKDIGRRCPGVPLSEAQRLMIAYALGGMVDNFLFEMYVDRNPLLLEEFPNHQDVAVFLAALWYRALYATTPPANKLGPLKGIRQLRFPTVSLRSDGGRELK